MAANNFKEDEKLNESLNIVIIKRLLSYLIPYKLTIVRILLLVAVVITIDLLNPYFLKVGIDRFIGNGDAKGLLIIGALMAVLNLASMFCLRYRIRIMSRVSNEILMTIRQNLYDHIQKLSFTFFDSRPVGKILARIIGDVNSLNDLFSNSVTNLIPEFAKVVAVAVIMMVMNFKLGLIALSMFPVLAVCMFLVQTISRKRWQVFRKKNSNMNAFTHEAFSGMRIVQSFTAERSMSKTFIGLLKEHRKAFISAVMMNDLFWPMVELSWGAGTILVYWFGVNMLKTNSITIGLLVAFTGYISMFWVPIMNMSNFYNNLVMNMSGAERIFEILDIKPDIEDSKEAHTLPAIKGNVVFDNVTFGYEDGQVVLDNVSFNVKQGETVALVGPTGVGKTTIVNLISRFYEAQQGKVMIDGSDIKYVTIESLRSQMGIMMQDTFLFSGTVKDNIKYGKLDATDEEMVAAAKAVNAHEFIEKMPKGYDTNVNERGSRLSVGQRQLIAFARALLANPRILILDEATASIDTHTERLIQQGIQNLLKGRTSFVIAHRLSTIQNADRIMVIEQGRIIEMGTHSELLKLKGSYYNLFSAQFKFLGEKQAV